MKRLLDLSPRMQVIWLVAVVLGSRLTLAWIFGAEVADLAQYRWMADIVGRGENIYQTPGLFHYTPLPMFLPAWSLQVAQALGLPFHFVVKWPMLLADAGITVLLWWQARQRGLPQLALWIGLAYALNPVSLLTTSFHGSYSVLPAGFTLLAYCLVSCVPANRYYRLSALSLGLAIGLRGYPVLFVPFFLRKSDLDRRRKTIFLILAALPSVITLLPFLAADSQAVWQGIFAYNGVTDYGWIASLRAYWLMTTGNQFLPGSMAADLLSASKWLFLAAYAVLTVIFWRKPARFSLPGSMLSTLLLFFGLYGGISSQYLIWAIPFALIVGSRRAAAYTWSAAASLIVFYLYYFPTVLFGQLPVVWKELNLAVTPFSLIFNTAFWGVCLAWVIHLVTRPVPDISVPSTVEHSPVQTQILGAAGPRRGQLFESIVIGYVGLIGLLGFSLLATEPAASQSLPETKPLPQPQQELQVTHLWVVDRPGSTSDEASAPPGLAVDKAGQIYVADRGNHRLLLFSPDGAAIATWSGDTVHQIPFDEPSDVAIDDRNGSVWVIDAGNGWIYRLGMDDQLTAVIDGAKLQLYNPRGLAISSAGDVFVADTGGGRILHLDQQGNVINAWGQPGKDLNQFRDPTRLVIQDDELFVADVNNQRIVHYTFDGQLVAAFETAPDSSWLAADGRGHLFASSFQTQAIDVYDYAGTLISRLTPGKELPPIEGLAGIAATSDGQLYAIGAAQLVKVQIDWP